MLPRGLVSKVYWAVSCLWYRAFVLPRLIREKGRKEKVRVVFLAMNVSMWKFDGLFRLLQKHPRFHPIVVSAMRPNESYEEQLEDQSQMEAFFKGQGFEFYRGLNVETGKWTPLETFAPDIIFYTQPYNGITSREYFFHKQQGVLFCYLPYAFETTTEKWTYNNPYQNFAWKVFLPTHFHVSDAQSVSFIKAKNCVETGYPTADEYANTVVGESAWRKTFSNCKKIIWAPHHSIEERELYGSSSFLEYFEVMLEIAEKFKSFSVFAFKPHPMLKTRLYRMWGAEKTDAYYSRWENLENGFFVPGSYRDLFLESDALIHDCGSFTVEYLYTGKPTMFLMRQNRTANESKFGKLAISMHYLGHSKTEVEAFIEDVVLHGSDTIKQEREKFCKEYLLPEEGRSVALNILEEMERGLGWRN